MTPLTQPAAGKPPRMLTGPGMKQVQEAPVQDTVDHMEVLDCIARVEVEAIVGGALQRISFSAGFNPASTKACLLALDPNAQVRDAWPMKGGGGKRDTKLARVLNIIIRNNNGARYIDLVAQNGEDLTIGVSKAKVDGFVGEIQGLGKLSEKGLGKLKKAFDAPKGGTVVVNETDQFGVRYWTTDDGKAFMDSVTTELPAETAGDGGADD